MKYLLLLLPAAAGGISYSIPLPQSRLAPSLKPHPSADPTATVSCGGGAEYPLRLEMTPTRILSLSGVRGEIVELRLDVSHKLGAGTRVIHSFEVVDDRGQTIVPASVSSPRDVPQGATSSLILSTPRLSTDGFYVLRASAAGKSTSDSDERTVDTYWQVRSGKVIQHDYADWFTLSNINQAVRQ